MELPMNRLMVLCRYRRGLVWPAVCLVVIALAASTAAQTELDRVLERLMAPPDLEVADGFTARVLIPPGELYDPLFMRDHDGQVWINDDGGEEGEKGSKIVAVDGDGSVSTIIPLGRLLPVIGFDIAPPSFAPYQGHIFGLGQAVVSLPGVAANHIIQRVDPQADEDGTLFCTLPAAGEVGGGAAGMGIDARFGPEESPFAGKFYAITILNGTVYQVAPDGTCEPFVTFDPQTWGRPMGLAFSRDGEHMLVSVGDEQRGSIARVRPDGAVDTPLVRSTELMSPTGMAFAPANFGAYAGQLFVATSSGGADIQLTQPMPANGHVYRIDPQGEVHVVVSGLYNPMAIHFTRDRLWVSDINGDFIAGRRELPEGFVIELRVSQG